MFKKLLLSLLFLGFIGTATLWATSYTHYTSLGIDHDQHLNNDASDSNGKSILHSYYRVRWPGNGSIWFGGGQSKRPIDSPKPFEAFDLAATFLYPSPELPAIESAYNKAGFWLKTMDKPSKQFWIGVPAWLPVVIFGFLSLLLWRRLKKHFG